MRSGDLRPLTVLTVRPHRQKRRAHQQGERAEPELVDRLQDAVLPTLNHGVAGSRFCLNAPMNAVAVKRLCLATNRLMAMNARRA
jgi:hypothetical protein